MILASNTYKCCSERTRHSHIFTKKNTRKTQKLYCFKQNFWPFKYRFLSLWGVLEFTTKSLSPMCVTHRHSRNVTRHSCVFSLRIGKLREGHAHIGSRKYFLHEGRSMKVHLNQWNTAGSCWLVRESVRENLIIHPWQRIDEHHEHLRAVSARSLIIKFEFLSVAAGSCLLW